MGLNTNKILITSLILLMLAGFIFATTTTGVINSPTIGDIVGHNYVADFNLADDVDNNYFIKTVQFWISINDVNVLPDFNVGSSYGESNSCVARGSDNNSTGSLQCTINVSTAVREISEGTATMTIHSYGSDDVVDTNTSNAFEIIKSYRIQDDEDVNSYTQADIQDLAESGVGEGERTFIILIGSIITVLILIFVAIKIKEVKKA